MTKHPLAFLVALIGFVSWAPAQGQEAWSKHMDRLEVRLPSDPHGTAKWVFFRGFGPSTEVESFLSVAPGRDLDVRILPAGGDGRDYDLVRTEERDSQIREDYAKPVERNGLRFVDPNILRVRGTAFRLRVLRRSAGGIGGDEVAALTVYPASRWNPGAGFDVLGGAIQGEGGTLVLSPFSLEMVTGMSVGIYGMAIRGPGYKVAADNDDPDYTIPAFTIPALSVGPGVSWHFPLGSLWREYGASKPMELSLAVGLKGFQEHGFSSVPFVGLGVRLGF